MGKFQVQLDSFSIYLLFLLATCMIIGCALFFEYNKILIFVLRIPTFILGILVALKCLETKPENSDNNDFSHNYFSTIKSYSIPLISNPFSLLFLTVFCLIFFFIKVVQDPTFNNLIWSYGLWWYPFIITTLPICLILSYYINLLSSGSSKFKVCFHLRKSLVFFGLYSFEIYLAHSLIFGLDSIFVGKKILFNLDSSSIIGSIILYTFLGIISLFLACVYKKINRIFSELFTAGFNGQSS